MGIKGLVKKILAPYHYGMAKVYSNKLAEESTESLCQYFKGKGYVEGSFLPPTEGLKETTMDLSFILPVYNCGQFIGYCLDTILQQQTKYSYEVICVNDGSKDNSLEVLKEYQAKYPEKLVVIDQKNGGASKARNTGIENARGEYLAFVDSDDFVFENYIDTLMDCAKRDDADIVQAGYCRVLPDHTIIDSNPRQACRFEVVKEPKMALDNVSGYLWSGVIRKSLFDNLRFANGYWYEDMMTRSVVMRRAKRISVVADCLYGYTCNPNSLSTTTWDSHKIKCLDQIFIAKQFQEYSTQVLHLKDDALNLSVMLQELGKMACSRIHCQPGDVKKKAFLLIHNILKDYPKGIEPLTDDLKVVYKAIQTNDYAKWLHWCLWLQWR